MSEQGREGPLNRSDPRSTPDRDAPMRWWGILAVFVLIACVLLVFVRPRQPAPPPESETSVPVVHVRTLEARDIQVTVEGQGTVGPQVEVDIRPEVGGRIVFVHSEMKTGGIIPAGEKILEIDPGKYELAVQQAQARVGEAQAQLEIEMAQAEAARKEWRRLNKETDPDWPLVFREPQIRRAKAALAAAQTELASAELELQRTSISLPFDVLVVSEQVELGECVEAGQSVAKVYGTDAFEIEVPLADSELAWVEGLDVPSGRGLDALEDGNTAVDVKATFAGQEHSWDGRIVGAAGRIDTATGRLPIIVEVPKPMERSAEKPPLLPGALAKVLVAGKVLHDAFAVPREAIHDGNEVWLVEDDQLQKKKLDIVREDKKFAYVTIGLPNGAKIVIRSLGRITEGAKVQTQDDEADPNEQTGLAARVSDGVKEE